MLFWHQFRIRRGLLRKSGVADGCQKSFLFSRGIADTKTQKGAETAKRGAVALEGQNAGTDIASTTTQKTDARRAAEYQLTEQKQIAEEFGVDTEYFKMQRKLEHSHIADSMTPFGQTYHIQKKSNGKYVAYVDAEGSSGFNPVEFQAECESFDEAYLAIKEYFLEQDSDAISDILKDYEGIANHSKEWLVENDSEAAKYSLRNTEDVANAPSSQDQESVIDLSEDNRLSSVVAGIHGSERYKKIREYILVELANQPIRLSDGKFAIVDRSDAQHIARNAGDKKTTEISHIKQIIEVAQLVAEEESAKDRKFDYFWYYETFVKYDGEMIPVYVNVGRARNDSSYHIYDLTQKIRDTAHRVNDVERPKPNEGYALENGISNNSVPQTGEKSNSFSKKSSKTGKATRLDDGTEATVEKIVSVKDGVATVKLSDGSTVQSTALDFGSDAKNELYDKIPRIEGMAPESADALIGAYSETPTISAQQYARAVELGYLYGAAGIRMDQISRATEFWELSESQRKLAYELGATVRAKKDAAREAEIREQRERSALKTKKTDKKTADLNEKSKSAEKGKITVGMSEGERAAVLRNKRISPAPISQNADLDIDSETLETKDWEIAKKLKKPIVQKLRELGFLKNYRTEAIDVDFEFTGNGALKSANSQILDYGGSLGDFAKVVMNLQAILDRAVLLEVHNDKAVGTSKENSRLLQTYVLLGAFQEGNFCTPVQFEIKQYTDNKNRLYLAVALTKIETGVVSDTAPQGEGRTRLLPVSDYSIAELIQKVNTADENFFKYIPDEFLTPEQLEAKRRALAKEAKKYGRTEAAEAVSKTEKTARKSEIERQKQVAREKAKKSAIVIEADSELAERIKTSNKSKYTVIRDYLVEKFGGQNFTLSDGLTAIMDKRDAQHLAHLADDIKTAELSDLKNVVEKAEFSHEAPRAKHDKFNAFRYYAATVKVGEEGYDILINVGRSKYDQKYHIYDITKNGRVAGQASPGLSRPGGYAMRNNSSTDSISQTEEKNNTFSENNSEEASEESSEVISKTEKTTRKEGTVTVKADESALSERQKVSVECLRSLAKAIGVNFVVENLSTRTRMGRVGENGRFDRKTNTVYLDLNAGNDGEGVILYTASHELTHFIAKWSPKKYKILRETLFDFYGKTNKDVIAMAREQMAAAKEAGHPITFEAAIEEVVADAMERMLTDGNAQTFFETLEKKDKSLVEKIKDYFKDLLAKIRKAYEGAAFQSDEAQFLHESAEAVERIQALFFDALADAGETYREIGDTAVFEETGESFSLPKVESDEGKAVANFIDSVSRMIDQSKRSKRKLKIGKISSSHSRLIESLMKTVNSNFSAEGYELWIDGTGADHINRRHGENGQADHSMATREARELIPWVANNPDSGDFIRSENGKLQLSNRYFNADGSKAPQIRLEKKLSNDILYVSECVPDSVNKRVYITSAYIKKGSTNQLLNIDSNESPQPTPEASFDGSATTNSIPEITQKVNSNSENNSDSSYSIRKSNRSTLTAALDSVVTDPEERRILDVYRANIENLDAQQERLQELNAEIKNLSFSDGAKDRARVSELRQEAIKTQNRINLYDKKLLGLEAMAPMKRVVERQAQKAYEKAAERGRLKLFNKYPFFV